MHTPRGKQSQRLVSARWNAKPRQKGTFRKGCVGWKIKISLLLKQKTHKLCLSFSSQPNI